MSLFAYGEAGLLQGRVLNTFYIKNEAGFLECFIASNRFGTYCVPASSSHRPAAKRIINRRVHEPRTIRFLRQNARDGDIVHAGTYFGDFIPALSKVLRPERQLWAFEPVRENFLCAKRTIELNGLQNVRIKNAALGASPGQAQIVIEDASGKSLGGGSRIAEKNRPGTMQVQIVTIDNVVRGNRKVTLIQLDVEGYELPALQGAWATIQHSWPILILEILGNNKVMESPWFIKNILGSGYQVLGKVHENTVLARPGTAVNDEMLK